ncbi:MAG: 7-carboxy-7-deazaguanine synthase QueE [Bacteroidales bacterium]|nr:7-carboxy-7-deazaguanine synthase QueE [Bacteroidales bacterium]
MARYIIRPGEKGILPGEPDGRMQLSVCELFVDAVQGEGPYAGCPSVFLRLSGCHLGCIWCDTIDIWGKSCRLSTGQLAGIFRKEGIMERLERGHHLVVTGGSPMLQQDALTEFLGLLSEECVPGPFVEVENECTLPVSEGNSALWDMAGCWNNSPKLSHSGVAQEKRYNPAALLQMKMAREAWFKFVVRGEADWNEIQEDFIRPGLVDRQRVIIMPEGQTREELNAERKQAVLEMAVEHDVRYGGRLQIDVYDNRKGV